MSHTPDRVSQENERPFDEPWQAEAFALTVALNEAGHLEWSDWARVFSARLAEQAANQAPASPGSSSQPLPNDAASNAAYWRAWVQSLEQVVRDKGFAGPLQLGAHREAVRAYRRVSAGTAMFRKSV
ncbi:MAG: nitrile hydratase accessory protein [Burkholderiaceae bacterium]